MVQIPQNSRPTRNKVTTHITHKNDPKRGKYGVNLNDYYPRIESTTDCVFSRVQNFENNHNLDKIYTDQTGQFPSRSIKG